MNIVSLALSLHEASLQAGWWEAYPNKFDRHDISCALISSECVEALEGNRKSLMDDHLPHHKMFDVEIADAMIRAVEMLGAYQVFIEDQVFDWMVKMKESHIRTEKMTIPEMLNMVMGVSSCRLPSESKPEHMVRIAAAIIAVARVADVDVWTIGAEKAEYNRTRADHSKTARAGVNGKKF